MVGGRTKENHNRRCPSFEHPSRGAPLRVTVLPLRPILPTDLRLQDQRQFREAGADAVITKPVTFDAVAAMLTSYGYVFLKR